MTQKFYSLFVEHYLEGLLSPLGSVEVSGVITDSERRGIVLFFPKGTIQTERHSLGLLAKVAQSDCSIEVYYEQIGETEVRSCLHKLLSVFSTLNCRASTEGKTLDDNDLPRLWIVVPSASQDLLNSFGAQSELENWTTGIYFLPNVFRLAIVAINQLPVTSETLWLRLLGRGVIQKQAVSELIALPSSNRLRQNVLDIVYRWRISVMTQTELTRDDQELIMNLTQAYEEARAQAVQEGVEQGVQLERRQVVENLLRFRFGSVDEELARVVDNFLQLAPDDFARFLLELSSLSREDLLARFNSHQ